MLISKDTQIVIYPQVLERLPECGYLYLLARNQTGKNTLQVDNIMDLSGRTRKSVEESIFNCFWRGLFQGGVDLSRSQLRKRYYDKVSKTWTVYPKSIVKVYVEEARDFKGVGFIASITSLMTVEQFLGDKKNNSTKVAALKSRIVRRQQEVSEDVQNVNLLELAEHIEGKPFRGQRSYIRAVNDHGLMVDSFDKILTGTNQQYLAELQNVKSVNTVSNRLKKVFKKRIYQYDPIYSSLKEALSSPDKDLNEIVYGNNGETYKLGQYQIYGGLVYRRRFNLYSISDVELIKVPHFLRNVRDYVVKREQLSSLQYYGTDDLKTARELDEVNETILKLKNVRCMPKDVTYESVIHLAQNIAKAEENAKLRDIQRVEKRKSSRQLYLLKREEWKANYKEKGLSRTPVKYREFDNEDHENFMLGNKSDMKSYTNGHLIVKTRLYNKGVKLKGFEVQHKSIEVNPYRLNKSEEEYKKIDALFERLMSSRAF